MHALEEEIGLADTNALIESNLMAIRTWSTWARDLPKEAFGENCLTLATAASAPALFCMRKLQAEGRLSVSGWGPEEMRLRGE